MNRPRRGSISLGIFLLLAVVVLVLATVVGRVFAGWVVVAALCLCLALSLVVGMVLATTARPSGDHERQEREPDAAVDVPDVTDIDAVGPAGRVH